MAATGSLANVFRGYTVDDGTYSFDSASFFPQRPCNRLDSADMSSIAPSEPGAFVVPTLVDLLEQVASPPKDAINATCNVSIGMPGLDAASQCVWETVSSVSRFVADAEWTQVEVRKSYFQLLNRSPA